MNLNYAESWRIPNDFERIVAVGDIHGDLDALLRILIGMQLINSNGDWIAPQCCLVLLGDLNDRGPDSIAVLDAVMQLEKNAQDNHGVVYCLLGNHEMMIAEGDFGFFSPIEILANEHFWYGNTHGVNAVYRGHSPYANWLRQRPALLQIGSTLFVHAGLGEWCMQYTPDVINQTLQDWMAYFQEVGESPPASTAWLTEQNDHSPIWTRCFRVGRQSAEMIRATQAALHHLSQVWEFQRMVSGHNPTLHLDYHIAWPHPLFGDSVAVIDTGICRVYDGRLSALESRYGEFKACYFERGDDDLALTKHWREACKQRLQALSDAHR